MGKYRGKSQHRVAHPKIYVWSHTRKAEILYFQEFKNHLRSTQIMPGRLIRYTPQELIESVIDWKQSNVNDEDNDQVWCIFDVDDFYKEDGDHFLKLIKQAHENNIRIAFVNECFEHWILLHFKKIDSQISRGAEIEKAINAEFKKRGLGRYKKNMNIFKILLPYQQDALKNVEDIDWPSALGDSGNPSTSFHILINEILRIS